MAGAVMLAEKFVRENGYTDVPGYELKASLDLENIEPDSERSKILATRHNTLLPNAIGAKPRLPGWSVAFDYAHPRLRAQKICRVVTMNADGTGILMQHSDGIRKYFQSGAPLVPLVHPSGQ